MQQDHAVYEEMLRRGSRGLWFWRLGSWLRNTGILGIIFLLLVWPVGLYFKIADVWLLLFLALVLMAGLFTLGVFLKKISYKIAVSEGLDIIKCLTGTEPRKP